MTKHATSAFTVDQFNEVDGDDAEGVRIAHARITKTFTGDIDGKSVVEMLGVSTPAGPAAYVGIERVTAKLDGRSGTFVFRHVASATEIPPTLELTVVRGSGTGEFRGITGTAKIDIDEQRKHTLEFDYDFE